MSNSNKMSQLFHRMLRKPEDKVSEENRSPGQERPSSRMFSSNRSSLLFRESDFPRLSEGKFRNLGESPTKPIREETPEIPARAIPPRSLNIPAPQNCSSPKRANSLRKAQTLPVSLGNSPNVENIVQEFESGFRSPRSGSNPRAGNYVKKLVAALEARYNTKPDAALHRHSDSNICHSLNFAANESFQSNESINSESSFQALKDQYRQQELPYYDSEMDTYFVHFDNVKNCSRSFRNLQGTDSQRADLRDTAHQSVETCSSLPGTRCCYSKPDTTLERKKRAPVVIGGLLKTPIKVKDISIDWVPFNEKKLPRKKSLKRIIKNLTSKILSDKKDLFPQIQINGQNQLEESLVNEEILVTWGAQVRVGGKVRVVPDSGYEEHSSASSRASIMSYSDVVKNGMKIHGEKDNEPKSTNLSSFQDQTKAKDDLGRFCLLKKKIHLHEVDREQVTVDLGPCFPSTSRITNRDRRVTSLPNAEITNFPAAKIANLLAAEVASLQSTKIANLPVGKIDDLPAAKVDNLAAAEVANLAAAEVSSLPASKIVNLETDDSEEVVLRRPRGSTSTFHSCGNVYDVPRRNWSQSGAADVLQFSFGVNLDDLTCGRPKQSRPKSSAFEDAQSLKRRNVDASRSRLSQDYYSSPSPPKFATIKSRSTRYLNPDVFMSTRELGSSPIKKDPNK